MNERVSILLESRILELRIWGSSRRVGAGRRGGSARPPGFERLRSQPVRGMEGSTHMEIEPGTIALITGAGAGIGRGCAIALAAAGATAVGTDINSAGSPAV